MAAPTICGLANVGETCYLHTLIQCLRASPSFRAFILSTPPAPSPATPPTLTSALRELFDVMDNTPDGIIGPNGFVHAVATAFSFLEVRSQNDVHEMFMLLVARIAEELKSPLPDTEPLPVTPVPMPEITAQAFHKLIARCDRAWRDAFVKEYSPLTNLIHGQLLAQIVCGHCRYIHHNYQPFSVWEIEVLEKPGPMRPTLEECFLASMAPETLNDWKCDKCGQTTASQKISKVWRLPQLMVLCLKRFKQGSRGLKKIVTQVDIPTEVQMFPMQLGPHNAGIKYTLCSAAVHMGDIQFGHYHAICNTSKGWGCINDGRAFPVNFKEGIVDSYMLFYEAGVASPARPLLSGTLGKAPEA